MTLLIKVALAPLPIYRSWTKKSREKTMRLEKEIVMLRQLLDNAIPENASSYLTLVSEGLREIEEVSYIRSKHRANMYYAVGCSNILNNIAHCLLRRINLLTRRRQSTHSSNYF